VNAAVAGVDVPIHGDQVGVPSGTPGSARNTRCRKPRTEWRDGDVAVAV
jgi:hypothetical protein